MLKKLLIPSIALLPFLAAANGLAASESGSGLAATMSGQPHRCKLLALAIAQNPAVEEDKIVGTVYSVVGNIVSIEQDNGENRHVTLDWWERGHMGQLIGKKVVVRNVFCSRVELAPPPPPIVKPIEIPAIQFSPITPTVPPLKPRPTAEPTPAAPAVIPQTW
ncbi:MAG: hypothetical protein WCA35_00320 [Kovacikia sp.]